MIKRLCLERIRRLANRFNNILQFFGITCDALILILDLIWEDNFFIALGPLGPIFGRVLGCTMGNVVSMPLCRIYYFTSREEALNLVGMFRFFYAKSGGRFVFCVVS